MTNFLALHSGRFVFVSNIHSGFSSVLGLHEFLRDTSASLAAVLGNNAGERSEQSSKLWCHQTGNSWRIEKRKHCVKLWWTIESGDLIHGIKIRLQPWPNQMTTKWTLQTLTDKVSHACSVHCWMSAVILLGRFNCSCFFSLPTQFVCVCLLSLWFLRWCIQLFFAVLPLSLQTELNCIHHRRLISLQDLSLGNILWEQNEPCGCKLV